MHPLRKQRLQLVILLVAAAALVIGSGGLYAPREWQFLLYPGTDRFR